MTPDALPAAWRARANELRRFGADAQATTCEALADELEIAMRDAANEEAPIAEAARRKNWPERTLRDLVARGDVPAVPGSKPVRVRMGDVPRRPKRVTENGTSYDPARDAAELLGKR